MYFYNMKIGIIAFLFLTLVTSCSDLNKDEQLNKVGRLMLQVDSLQVALQEHRIDTLVQIRTAVNSIETRIRNNYSADTINLSLGQQMEKFRQLKKFFMAEHEPEGEEEYEGNRLNEKTLGKAYLVVKRGILTEKRTLEQLKSDISNGFGKRDKYNEYIEFETGKVNQLCVLLEDYKAHKDKILKDFKDVYAVLNVFATKLESEKKAKAKK
jgi:hypothetical protein